VAAKVPGAAPEIESPEPAEIVTEVGPPEDAKALVAVNARSTRAAAAGFANLRIMK